MNGIKHWKRIVALLAVLALVAAACGDDDDASGDTTTTAAPAATTAAPAATTAAPATTTTAAPATTTAAPDEGGSASADGVLTIGTLLPVTGDLAFLGPPEVAGARLAIEDINAAGGALGQDVVLHEGDSGDTNQDIANPEVDRLMALNVDAIMGAASSAVSKLVIDKITGNNVIHFSPANTSPDFTTYDDNGLYFRTAPSDLLQGKVLADQVAGEGNETVAVLYRQESYGQGLADAFKANFEALGGVVEPFTAYAVDTENFDAEIDAIVATDPDAIVVIGFAESANILTTMHERGIGPTSDKNVWGVDGNIGGIGAELSDPSIIAGMKGTEPSVDLASIADFTDRLDGAYEGGVGGVFAYGAETYDSVVIVALAAIVAGSDDPLLVAAEINGVTKGGEKCTNFADCKAIAEAGGDVDYDGNGGPYEFVDAGEPAAASFRIATYDGGETPNLDLDVYVFAS
ncbi:MAG: ABC transporter substrate-binding protein [Actinomycetota bacterium]|nr:ABC transporter substrate-binding protein [Actinomycetota bacterium]